MMSRSEYVNRQAFEILLSKLNFANSVALRVSLESGMRIDDVLSLKKSDLHDRAVVYVAKKTGKRDKKLLSDYTSGCLWSLARKSKNDFVFFGNGEGGHRTRQAVYTALKKVVRQMELAGQISPHSARKIYAVDLYDDKGLEAVRKALQHDNVSTTLMYALSDKLQKRGGEASSAPLATELERIAEAIATKTAEKVCAVLQQHGMI